ncbi:MAG TPA: spore germination protein GerW family protein [Ktedonobacterales bacterium]|nr:spore germination protein GerW family protein [Ktedonobacterales bacterium]
MTTSGRRVAGEQTMEAARGALTTEAPSEQAAERTLGGSLARMIDSVGAEAIFGAPVEREGVTIIPCSEVMVGFGMGGGSGFGPATNGHTERATAPAEGANVATGGGGIGGGGGAQGRPVAVVAISEGKARVLPVVDVTKFMLAALTSAGFMAFWITQALARSRAPRERAVSANSFARAMQRARRSAF